MSFSGVDGSPPPADEAGIHLVPEHEIGPLSEAAAARGVPCVRVDLDDCATKRGFLDRMSGALELPAPARRNWDAFADALGDLGRPGAPGLVLLLLHSDRIRRESPGEFQTAMEVLQAASTEWVGRRCLLRVLVALPVGGVDGPPRQFP